ncbi:MAG: elongation factor P [Clostridiaceae bacterium]|mgnify:FL=1|nr:elongation factor P [Clostridiaceae bacterium]
MISAGDFRNGVTFEMDGHAFQVVEFQHVKPGKGSAFVRVKYRNLKSGSVVERTFNPSEKFEQVRLERADMSYIYKDGELYYFMNTESYEQIPIHQDLLGDVLRFLKEGMVAHIVTYKGEILQVELPISVELEVTQSEPAVRGDTAQSAMKTVVIETGAEIKVPMFVETGDIIRIDTRSGEYLERA